MRATTASSYELIYRWIEEDLPKGAEFCGLQRELEYYLEAFRQSERGDPGGGLKPASRPHLTRLFYELGTGHPHPDGLPVFALAELFNISAHQMNLALDHKVAGDAKEAAEKNQAIASFLTLGKAYALLDRYFTGEARRAASQLVSDCLREIYSGQYLDLNVLQVSRLDALTPEEFARLYLRRCASMGGGTYEICALGPLAAGQLDDGFPVVRQFLRSLGTAAQVLNDISDSKTLFLAAPRLPLDLIEGKLTFPLFLLLQLGEGRAAWQMEDPAAKAAQLGQILRSLNLKSAAGQFLRRHVWKDLRYHQRQIIKVYGKQAGRILNFTSHFVFASRYYPKAYAQ